MHNEILYIYKDTRDSLWIATREGLNIYLPSQDIIKEFSRLRDLPHYKVYQVLEDHENNIWLATEKGLSRFDPIKGTIKSFFKPTSTNKSGISDNFIKSLLLDSDHNLWIGTGNGLNRYDYQTGEFNMFFEPDGLIHNVIGSINEDKQKNIWIQTYTGVSVYDKSTKLFKNFDESNGLRINSTANHVDKNGVFYYGEQHNGLYAFYPDSISSSTPAPPIYITSIESSGREVSVDPTRPGLLYKINPGEKYVKFNYTALSYMSKENNRFTYILEGFEEEWKSFGTQNTEAYYSKLPPGNYTFKVKHYNQDKTVPMGDMVSIRVLPRWWKTGWAFTLYFLLLAFLVVLFRMIKIRRARLIEYYSRERQRIQLEQKHDQLRLRLITNIVHEFRTPLTLILGISEKIIDHVRGIPEATRDKKILNNNITRINRLLEQLIDLRKIDNNAFRLKVFHYNLKDEVTDVFDSFKILAEKNKFTYHYKAHENDDETWFDKDIVEKVLYNLLSNAFKYTPEGGSVEVLTKIIREKNISNISMEPYPPSQGNETATDNPFWIQPTSINEDINFAIISVKDSGRGMPAEYLTKLFNRFSTNQEPLPDKVVSTGLGLSYIKELAQAHKGIMKVWSKQHYGSIFSFIFPVSKATYSTNEIITGLPGNEVKITSLKNADTSNTIANMALNNQEKERELILIVEDNQDVREYIESILSMHFRVMGASSGKEGFEKAQKYVPSLIITDIMMPVMDGFQFCSMIKKDLMTSHIPVIMLTALSSNDSRIEGYENRADEFIVKPFNAQVLLSRVYNLIESRAKLREIYRKNIFTRGDSVEGINKDQKFLQKLKTEIENHIVDENFNVESLASIMALSRSQLHRKLTSLLDMSPLDLIRQVRLEKAREVLLKNKDKSISEVGYMVGYKTTSHFVKSFKKYYGKTPGEFIGS